MEIICQKNQCTGCGLCINVCPKSAISFKKDLINGNIPVIDQHKCVDCYLCKKKCPANSLKNFQDSKKAFASWNINETERNNAASGGVASKLQENALKKGYVTYGVFFDSKNHLLFHKLINTKDIKKSRNSKYVYSNMTYIFKDVKNSLNEGNIVLFIGMPCQVAAIKNYIGENKKLILIDLVCHGMPPEHFFLEHIENMKKKKLLKKIDEIKFRLNNNYNIYIYSNDKKIVLNKNLDPYIVGFHEGLIYRDSCYQCKYAQPKRVSDITLCDFWGIDKDSFFKNEIKKGITAILINTDKGFKYLNDLKENIVLYERKCDEVIKNNGQLREPPKIKKERRIFIRKYKFDEFDRASISAFKWIIFKRILFNNDLVYNFKLLIKKILVKKRGD